MKKTFTVSKEINEEQIVNLLANGLADVCGFDNIDYISNQYGEAKKQLLSEGKNDLCREDVLARMLFLGYSIKLHESEESENKGWYDLTLDNILKQNIDFDKLEENGDFYDNDAILQIACYGKVIYG